MSETPFAIETSHSNHVVISAHGYMSRLLRALSNNTQWSYAVLFSREEFSSPNITLDQLALHQRGYLFGGTVATLLKYDL